MGVAVLAAAALAAQSVIGQRDAEWQARVETESARAEHALAIGDSLRVEADSLEALADSLAGAAHARDTVIVTMIEELPAPPPDCEPFTAPRDSVIAEQERRYADASAALENQRSAADQLRLAEAKARESADSLLAVLADRPRPLSPFIPEVGVGPFAGICATGQPCAGFGVSLSWKVRLF